MSVRATEPPPLITECPNCQTRFRVGESQLQMAHGRVRCGACLAVFAGVDHLLLDESAPPPELPADSDELESVLAELDATPATPRRGLVGKSADANKGPDSNTQAESKTEAETEKSAEAKRHQLEQDAENAAENADWTSVSVDTQEMDRNITQEEPASEWGDPASAKVAGEEAAPPENPQEEPRASISDALSDEEALRWWLEDELPGAVDSGVFDRKPDGDEMVVQLSQLDSVEEEELDLRALIGPSSDKSNARVLEQLFEEDVDEKDADQKNLDTEDTESKKPSSKKEEKKENTAQQSASGTPESETEPAGEEVETSMSRATENGTIAAAAERMTTSTPRDEESTATAPASEKSGTAPLALVESPHQPNPIEESISSKALHEDADSAKSDAAEPAKEAGIWESAEFQETPAELVEDITAEMAAAGQAGAEQPSIFERTKDLIDGFLGHVMALRVATALAFVLLTGQILYWQFADWSKTDTMRPIYARLCNVLGCELPARRSLRDLQSRKLAVRSHPEKEGALLVDALIINEANFEQPFPIIELQFMDMTQNVVGAYRLEPVTYLDGELLGSDALMAVRTPIHIDIDIPDPGPKAVNYQLQFR